MRQAKGWRSMVAWVLVGVLIVGLWAMPGRAKKLKEEKPKPIDGVISGCRQELDVELKAEYL